MATGIKVLPEQLAQISAQLASGAASIDGTNSQLAANVAPLGSDWAGTAQARFQELWAQWQRSSQQLNESLNGISQLMAQASGGDGDTETAIASSFNRGA
jgi:WXG100 family type VII secretion target